LSFSEAVKAGFLPYTGSTGHRKVGCGIACGGSQVYIAGHLGKQNGNFRSKAAGNGSRPSMLAANDGLHEGQVTE
jgi:hypothetical protein